MMRSPLRTVFSIMLLGIVIIAIESCCNEKKKTFRLTDEHRKLIPYTDQQVIKFRNASNQGFNVTVKRSEFTREFDFTECGGECCDVFHDVEVNVIEFDYSADPSLFNKIVISSYPTTTLKGGISFRNNEEYEDMMTYQLLFPIDVYADNNFQLVCNPSYCSTESLEIAGLKYDNVLKVVSGLYRATSDNVSNVYYFIPKLGIVKIQKNIYADQNKMTLQSTEEYFAVL